jgi:hypothetical protein
METRNYSKRLGWRKSEHLKAILDILPKITVRATDFPKKHFWSWLEKCYKIAPFVYQM